MCGEKEANILRMLEGVQMKLPNYNEGRKRKINKGGNAATVAGVG